jgi:hypothetical protein
MTSFNLSKVVGAGVLVASLATLPLALPASAQNGTMRDSTQAAPGDRAIYETGETDQGERSFDWGWIGLLGLVGLAGRLAKHRQETVVYRAPQETNHLGTTERYRDPQEMNRPRTDGTTNR